MTEVRGPDVRKLNRMCYYKYDDVEAHEKVKASVDY